ncbi:MAG: hypothetical protein ABI619_12135, partial [Betaproteobacteria bacterium]
MRNPDDTEGAPLFDKRAADRKAAPCTQFNTEEPVMLQKRIAFVVASAMALAFAGGVAVGQNSPPTQNKGVKVGAPTALDLTNEMDSVAGR